jgi:hypothetical protein
MRKSLLQWLAIACLAAPATAADQWLSNAHLYDGLPGSTVRKVNLRITDGRIAEITPAENRVGALDLRGAYVLPGFIDAHMHIEDPASARRALHSGVTTTRVLGDVFLKGLATRDLVRDGHVPGPQMLVSVGHVRPQLGEAFILGFPQFGRYLAAPLRGSEQVAEVVRAVIARGGARGSSERSLRCCPCPRSLRCKCGGASRRAQHRAWYLRRRGDADLDAQARHFLRAHARHHESAR